MRYLLAAAALAVVSHQAAAAGTNCGPRDDIVRVLGAKYKETSRAIGSISTRSIVEVFVSEKQTWTILVTRTNGMSCILAAGEDWESDAPKPVAGAPL